MTTDNQVAEATGNPRWQPLAPVERRVLGALIEKAKTTPENYPLSLNAVRTACNQKNNRFPLTQLEEEQVAEALENLRTVGAVAEIQGGGRVDKYRHLAYEWLGVVKVELAVMAELLLRGTQTVGELRGRAARMEPIKDLADLQPILDSLLAKGLVVRLTPAGRGSMITHALYTPTELDKERREAGARQEVPIGDSPALSPTGTSSAPAFGRTPTADRVTPDSEVGAQIHELHEEIAAVRRDLQAARTEFEATADELRRTIEELNRQLGN
jgi:uncharacterized protein YceH (UPF0502 family)